MTEIERLEKELAEARARIATLELTIGNLTYLLRKELREAGKLPNDPGTEETLN